MKNLGDPKRMSCVVSDLKERYNMSLLDDGVDFVEAAFLIRTLETDPSSMLGAIVSKKNTTYTQDTVLLGEILRSYVYANSKKKKEIVFPWDSDGSAKRKIEGAVVSKEQAERIFSNMRGKTKPPIS